MNVPTAINCINRAGGDTDGITDNLDLDDDNDGILDAVENDLSFYNSTFKHLSFTILKRCILL
jgi:hypothetical protein